jgi:hypothetical protein
MNRPVRTRKDSDEARARILEAAEEHFRRVGYALNGLRLHAAPNYDRLNRPSSVNSLQKILDIGLYAMRGNLIELANCKRPIARRFAHAVGKEERCWYAVLVCNNQIPVMECLALSISPLNINNRDFTAQSIRPLIRRVHQFL